jgi:hypothetical protein
VSAWRCGRWVSTDCEACGGRMPVYQVDAPGLPTDFPVLQSVDSFRGNDVIAALDHARIAQSPGGPAEMVPGPTPQHHARLNMYIARSEGGTFNVVKNLGHIDPNECEVGRS